MCRDLIIFTPLRIKYDEERKTYKQKCYDKIQIEIKICLIDWLIDWLTDWLIDWLNNREIWSYVYDKRELFSLNMSLTVLNFFKKKKKQKKK